MTKQNKKWMWAAILILGPWFLIKILQITLGMIELFQKSVTAGWISVVAIVALILAIATGCFILKGCLEEKGDED